MIGGNFQTASLRSPIHYSSGGIWNWTNPIDMCRSTITNTECFDNFAVGFLTVRYRF